MLKKLLTATLAFVILVTLLVPTLGFADYGSTVSLGDGGNRSDLIYIKRPESHSASTSDKTYTISATGSQGTTIKVYKYNSSTGTASIIKGGTKIGASGLYSVVVDLSDNSNTFVVTAEDGNGGEQKVQITISKIKKSTMDKLKGITVTIKNFLS